MGVEGTTRSGGECLRESWICSSGSGERGLGVWIPTLEGWSLCIFCLGVGHQRVTLQFKITCSDSTANLHGLLPCAMTFRGPSQYWGEVSPALWCLRGCPAWLERGLEHIDRKPTKRETWGSLDYSSVHFLKWVTSYISDSPDIIYCHWTVMNILWWMCNNLLSVQHHWLHIKSVTFHFLGRDGQKEQLLYRFPDLCKF